MPSQDLVYAPDFPLDVANGPALVLSELWRGHHLLLWFSRGLACPFCRRQIVQFAPTQVELQNLNVLTLQITSTAPETARTMLEYFPVAWPYACDPGGAIVAAFDLRTAKGPFVELAQEVSDQTAAMRLMMQQPAEPHPEIMPAVLAAGPILTREGGTILVERGGRIRFKNPSGKLSLLPSNEMLLKAVREAIAPA